MIESNSLAKMVMDISFQGTQVCFGIAEYYNQWRDFNVDIKPTCDSFIQLASSFELLHSRLQSDILANRPLERKAQFSLGDCEDGILQLRQQLAMLQSTTPVPDLNGRIPTTEPAEIPRRSPAGLQPNGRRRPIYPLRQGTLKMLQDVGAGLKTKLQPAFLVLNLENLHDVGKEVREQIADLDTKPTEETILSWISPLDFKERQKSILARRQPDTLTWFLTSPEYVAWFHASPDVDQVLWCHGKPGSGKSVLSATVIEQLQTTFSSDEVAVLFVFGDWQDPRSQNAGNLLGSLLRQSIEHLSSIPADIAHSYTQHKRGTRSLNAEEILVILEKVWTAFEKVYIVFDELDGCSWDAKSSLFDTSRMISLEKMLQSLISPASMSHRGRIQLFITCRFPPPITAKFQGVELQASGYDLRMVVLDMLANGWFNPQLALTINGDQQLKTQIATVCVENANETFLLPELYIAHLKSQEDESGLQRALENPHTNVDESLATLLQRIQIQCPVLSDLGLRALFWLCHSLRPMKVDELRHAVTVKVGDEDLSRNIPTAELLISSCAGLVIIEENTQIVRFSNLSVKEHLSSSCTLWSDNPHSTILDLCTTYLNFKAFDVTFDRTVSLHQPSEATISQNMVDNWLEQYPLLRYVACYWAEHTVLASEKGSTPRTIELLSDNDKSSFIHIIYHATYYQSIKSCPVWLTGLHLASFFGLEQVVLLLLNPVGEVPLKELVGSVDSFGRTPLWYATARGHKKVVDLLLAAGANAYGRENEDRYWEHTKQWWYPPWARDDYWAQALEVAAEEGYSDIVRLLVYGRASFAKPFGVHGGPLEAASFNGHSDVVDILLTAKVPVKRTALQAAVYGGSQDILQKLLNRIVEDEPPEKLLTNSFSYDRVFKYGGDWKSTQKPTSRKDSLQMTLYAAAMANRMEMVKMLLEHGAKINFETDGFHGSALAAASSQGYTEMVQLLLKKGADVNQILPKHKYPGPDIPKEFRKPWDGTPYAKDSGRHRTALQAAAYSRRSNIVRILLNHGADINAPGGYFGTALQAASVSGDIEIVKLLLEHGAEVNTSEGLYGNPLQGAAFRGHHEVLETLIKAGANVNLIGGKFHRPIMAAAASGNPICLELLLNSKADVNSVTTEIGCALSMAAAGAEIGLPKETQAIHLLENRRYENLVSTELDDFVKLAEQRKVSQGYTKSIFRSDAGLTAQKLFQAGLATPVDDLEPIEHEQDFLSCVRILLKHGADPNLAAGPVRLPLIAAIKKKNLEIVKELVSAGANVCKEFPMRPNVLNDAVALDYKLFKHRSLNRTDPRRYTPMPIRTPLAAAVLVDHPEIVNFLLSNGANPNDTSLPEGKPLLSICRSSNVLALLLDYNIKIGPKALHHFAIGDSPLMVRQLIEAGANITSTDEQNSTPLHEAAGSGCDEDVVIDKMKLILSAGANANVLDSNGMTPLDKLSWDHGKAMLFLLQSGMDCKEQTHILRNILVWSPAWDKPLDTVAQWLVDHGVDINTGCTFDISSDVAEFTRRWEELQSGKTVRPSDEEFRKPDLSSLPSTSTYLSPWDDIEKDQEQKYNFLVHLAMKGPDNLDYIRFLLANGINLSKFGPNALLLAIRNRLDALAQCLIDQGVSASQLEIMAAFWKRVHREYQEERRDFCDQNRQRLGELALWKLKDEIDERKTWKEILERGTTTSTVVIQVRMNGTGKDFA